MDTQGGAAGHDAHSAALSSYTLFVDEAGRGACVGNLVYAALLVRNDGLAAGADLDALWQPHLPPRAKRAADSKDMTARARAVYFDAMVASCELVSLANDAKEATEATEAKVEEAEAADDRVQLWRRRAPPRHGAGDAVDNSCYFMTCSVSAQQLNERLLFRRARGVNLNTISYRATARLVQLARARCLQPTDELSIVADRLGHDAASHELGVARQLDANGSAPQSTLPWTAFTSEPRADANYKGVSIASVVAKVTRDRALGAACAGGGYPNEACTRWLLQRDNVQHPDPRVRYCWSNVQALLPQLIHDADTRARYTMPTLADDDDSTHDDERDRANTIGAAMKRARARSHARDDEERTLKP